MGRMRGKGPAQGPLRTQSGCPLATGGAVVRNSLEAGQGDNTCTKLRSRWLAAQATDRVAAEHDRHARTAEAEVAREARGVRRRPRRHDDDAAVGGFEEVQHRVVRGQLHLARDSRKVADEEEEGFLAGERFLEGGGGVGGGDGRAAAALLTIDARL